MELFDEEIYFRWSTAVISGVMALSYGCSVPASAASKPVMNHSSATQGTAIQAQRDLEIITRQTNGIDGKFNYSRIVSAGVPSSVATKFAGYLKAAGQHYTAPAYVQPAIAAYADKIKPEVVKESVSNNKARPAVDWGRVARVLGSEVECNAARYAFLAWYPLAACVPNPDGNGTWLVVLY